MDLDGTLVNSNKVITPRTLDALRQAQERGVTLAIATGRPVEGARHIVEQLELKERGGYAVNHNGAFVYDCSTGETLLSCPLAECHLPYLMRTAEREQCALVVYHPDEVLTTDAGNEYVQYSGSNNHLPVRQAKDFLNEAHPPFYKVLIVGDPERMAGLRDRMQREKRGELDFCLSELFFLECLAPGVSKMRGVEAIARHMGIDMSEVMAFGDADNDVEMIKRAGLGVAMGNAKEGALLAADVVTASNNEDGIAEVLERRLLND